MSINCNHTPWRFIKRSSYVPAPNVEFEPSGLQPLYGKKTLPSSTPPVKVRNVDLTIANLIQLGVPTGSFAIWPGDGTVVYGEYDYGSQEGLAKKYFNGQSSPVILRYVLETDYMNVGGHAKCKRILGNDYEANGEITMDFPDGSKACGLYKSGYCIRPLWKEVNGERCYYVLKIEEDPS